MLKKTQTKSLVRFMSKCPKFFMPYAELYNKKIKFLITFNRWIWTNDIKNCFQTCYKDSLNEICISKIWKCITFSTSTTILWRKKISSFCKKMYCSFIGKFARHMRSNLVISFSLPLPLSLRVSVSLFSSSLKHTLISKYHYIDNV